MLSSFCIFDKFVLTEDLSGVASIGAEHVQAAQKFITGLDARRLSKLSENR